MLNKLEPQDLIWLRDIIGKEFVIAKDNQDMVTAKRALRILNLLSAYK